jgi:hypothetical protein
VATIIREGHKWWLGQEIGCDFCGCLYTISPEDYVSVAHSTWGVSSIIYGSKCPYCHSTVIREINESELRERLLRQVIPETNNENNTTG